MRPRERKGLAKPVTKPPGTTLHNPLSQQGWEFQTGSRGQVAILMFRTESGIGLHSLVSFHWPSRLSGRRSHVLELRHDWQEVGTYEGEATKLPGL